MGENNIKLPAIDVRPHRHGMWTTFADAPDTPVLNEFVLRKWSEDGNHIWFMFDSHNFYKAAPDEVMEVTAIPQPRDYWTEARLLESDRADDKRMRERPAPKTKCSACGQVQP